MGANTGNNPTTEKDAGDAFLLKQGYTIVASGWQGDGGGGNRVTGQYPVVREPDGRPITKLITAEMVITKPAYTLGLAFDGERAIRAYPAVAARMSRVYFFPGTQHVPTTSENPGICKHAQNPNPYRETLRALLVGMQKWIVEGTAPPPSQYASLADGTLVSPVPAEKFPFPKIPGVTYKGIHNELSLKDLTVQPGRNIPGTSYTVLVSKIDSDGNDVAGVRSVTLRVPLGTYTGWNQRRAGLMEDEFCGNPGSFFPFAKTAAERGADPRPSLQERYGSRDAYIAKVEAAAQKLVSERFLLPEDAQRLIDEAKRRDLGF